MKLGKALVSEEGVKSAKLVRKFLKHVSRLCTGKNRTKHIEEVIKERTPGIFGQYSSFLTEKNGGYTVVPRSLRLALLAHTPTMPANSLVYQ